VGEEPFSAGAPADGAAVVGGVQEAVEGGLGRVPRSLRWSGRSAAGLCAPLEQLGPSSVEREGIPTGKCAERFGTLANYI
jgi:hypothetical protein